MKSILLFVSLTCVSILPAQVYIKGGAKIGDKQPGVSFILSDTSGNVWMGFGGFKSPLSLWSRYNGGLKKYKNKQLTNVYKTGAFSAAVQVGPEMYFTADNGLYTYRNDSMFYDLNFTLGTCLAKYKNKAWAGTAGKGIYEIDNGVKTQVHVLVNGNTMDSVYSLCPDGNILWVGTSRGLVRYDGTNFSLVQTPVIKMDNKIMERNQLIIKSMQVDGYGRLWILNGNTSDTASCLYFMDKSGFRDAMSYYHEQCYQWGSVPYAGFYLTKTAAYGHILMTTWWGVIEMSDQLYNHSISPSIVAVYALKTANSAVNGSGYTYESPDGKWYVSNETGLIEIDLAVYNQEPVNHNPFYNYFGRNETIDINDISANVCNDGTMFDGSDIYLELENKPVFKAKSLGCENALFSAGLWMGGVNKGNGDLHVAAQTYRQKGFDYIPGPLNKQTLSFDTALAYKFNRIWKINKSTIDEFLARRQTSGYKIPQEILDWPGNAPANCIQEMAPYEDVDHNGVYEPAKGDYPKIKGDQMLWWVFNDAYQHFETGGKQLKVQINASAYAYKDIRLAPKDQNFLVNRSIFFEYKVHNLSDVSYNNFYLGIFNDVDLGNFTDDCIGTDSSENVAFAFNAKNVDPGPYGFGKNPPMVACKFLNQKMSNVKYYSNDLTANGNPNLDKDYYAYLRSAYYASDSTLVYQPHYAAPGYPCEQDLNQVYKGDQRFLPSCNIPEFKSGETFSLDFAYILLHDPNTDVLVDSCNKPKKSFKQIQEWYDNNTFPSKPYWPTGIAETGSNGLNMYPNPAHTVLNIQSNVAADLMSGTICVFDNTGKLVIEQESDNSLIAQLDISGLSSGIYVVKVMGSQQVFTGKFIKD